jgi:hypothetical protein
MAFVVNPPLRDNAIFEAVMKEPSVEPRILRAYLVDPRNTLHREEVTKRLSRFYDAPISHVTNNGKDPVLRAGMAKMLESLREADQPIVSVRVTEKNTPPGQEGKKGPRENQLRTDFATGINNAFSGQPWGGQVPPPPGVEWKEPPPPIGQQLIAFIEPPEGADKVHFDIEYAVEPGDFGALRLVVTVAIRTNIEADPVARGQFTLPGTFDAASLDVQIPKLSAELIARMVGTGPGNPGLVPGMGMPPIIVP